MEPIIKFEKVSIFQHHNLILANINLEINKGEFVYMIGKTGSGKSSFLRSIYADNPITQGKAVIAGYDMRQIRAKEIPFLRRKLGIVFQDFQLLMDRSVSENLTFVMRATGWKDKKEMEKRTHEVLAKVNLETKGKKLAHQLSGGEQQRVVIARALINEPEIILADEPTGNLDPETSEGIIQLLYDISRTGSAVLLATHNYTFFEKFPSRTLRCEDGNIVEQN
ncbi:MAG: cell division ATP-binding protein FtsE [Syntrophothermus sp.]